MTGNIRSGMVIFLALTVALSTLGVGVALAGSPSDELNYDDDAEVSAPNPEMDIGEVTVSNHPVSQGLSDGDMAGVYDDSGNWDGSPGWSVNTSSPDDGVNENPYSFAPGHVATENFAQFPRTGVNDDGEQEASALDAAEWSTSPSTSGTMSANDVDMAEGVDGVQLVTSGVADGETATATYNNWTDELDSDEDKRVLQLAADVDSLDSNATVDVNVTDEDGDVKQVSIDPNGDVTNAGTMATATGESYVTQAKLSELSTIGTGSWNNIEKVEVGVHDADADVSFSWVDLERKDESTLASQRVDSDGDGVYDDTEEVTDAQGDISTYSMTTIGSIFDGGTLNDVSFPATTQASEIEGTQGQDGDYLIQWEDADQYPSYDKILETNYRFELVSYIDVSYSSAELKMEQQMPTTRYTEFGYAEGVSDGTEFDNATLTDLTGSLAGTGTTVTIDDTVQVGTNYVVSVNEKLTGPEADTVKDTGGSAAPIEDGGGGGGIIGFLTSIPGMLIAFGTGILGFRWFRG